MGKESAAAKFASATPSKDFTIQNGKPYAEVCVHQSLSSRTFCSVILIRSFLIAMDGYTPVVALQGFGNAT